MGDLNEWVLTPINIFIISLIARRETDSDGRCSTLLAPGTKLEKGTFKMHFQCGEYFEKQNISYFYPYAEVCTYYKQGKLDAHAFRLSSSTSFPINITTFHYYFHRLGTRRTEEVKNKILYCQNIFTSS